MDKFAYFRTGTIVATRGISDKLEREPTFKKFIEDTLFNRYMKCDWGDVSDENAELNNNALKNDDRILAAYKIPKSDDKIWIITECDRSVTTILFPSEY